MRALLLALLLAVQVGSVSPASAAKAPDMTTEAAAAHTATGTTFFEAGEFEKARIEFEAAYKLTKLPELLFNISMCYEREGALRSALDYLVQYSAAKPEDAQAKAKIERMRAELGPAPTTQATRPRPAVAPETKGSEAASAPAPTLTTQPAPRKISTRRIVGLVLVGVAAVSLAATIGLGAIAEKDRRALESGTLTYMEAVSTAEHGTTHRNAAIALGVVFGLSFGAGVPLIAMPQK